MKKFLIHGPLYPIQVEITSSARLKKLWGKGDIYGMFDPDRSTIYIDAKLDPLQKKHTFLHELNHAVEYQLNYLDEEGRCEVMGAWFFRYLNTKKLTNEI